MSKTVETLIITGVGLNCERETAKAFDIAGAVSTLIHLNDLLEDGSRLGDFDILAFIGGFSFGDHLGAGSVFSNKIKHRLRGELERFVSDGKLVIGICNGFQTLTRLGLLPALDGEYFTQQVALSLNDSTHFRDDWVNLKAEPASPCIFTKGLDQVSLPIRHGEGKFVADDDVIARIEGESLVVLRYCDENGSTDCAFPANPNGSINNIAGICDTTGRVFGMMPHPEAFLSPYNAPNWQERKISGDLPDEGEGVVLFRNAVEYIRRG
ncbi:MAG: phosphoribosylformylglycinamidine synthase I [Kiritimatiellaeota bacterium]|nr:phosphoribosylformylglycinamidine synthase I [Kiritimatiellota bacterium]